MRSFLVGPAALLALGGCVLGSACGGAAFSASAADAGASNQPEGGPRDAASDADAALPEAGPSWCSTQIADFCEDFDGYPADAGGLLGGATWNPYGQSNGSFDFDTTSPKSPPNSLQVVGDDGARLFIVHSLPALAVLPKRVRLEFDLRVNSPGTEAPAAVAGFAAVAFGTSLDGGYTAVSIASGGLSKPPVLSVAWVDPASTSNMKFNSANGPMGSVPSAGQWAGRYGLELDLASATGGTDCAMAYQVPNLMLTTCLPLPAGLAKPGIISVVLGDVAGGLGMIGHVDLEFDNVTVTVTK